MNWTYLDSPIVCEECNVVLEEHSGYVGTQYGICDDCLARVQQSNTGLQSDVTYCPRHKWIALSAGYCWGCDRYYKDGHAAEA